MLTEELARIRVDEAIQEGIKAQHIQRSMAPREKPSFAPTPLMFGLTLLLAISLAACVVTVNTPAPTEPAPVATAEPATPPQFTITLDAEAISIPNDIPAGLVGLTMDNIDTQWHSAIIRQLNEGVSLEEFGAAFQEEPRSTFPMTSFIGGPDVPGGKTMSGYYALGSGTYVIVDNWVEPWRFTSFQVEGETAQAQPPQAEVVVNMNEYAFEMPESLPSGRQLWQFTNQGEFLHNLGIIRLGEGKNIDDVVAWTKEQQGPEPCYLGTATAKLDEKSPSTYNTGAVRYLPGPRSSV